MRRLALSKRTGFLAALTIAIALAAVFAAMLGADGLLSSPASPAAPPPTVPSEPMASRQPSVDSASAAQGAPVPPTDLGSACAAHLADDFSGGVTEECWSALEAHFLPRPVVRPVLPVSPPLTWGDVFGDIAADIEMVDVALADEVCAVPEGEIRPELAVRCGARAMAELHVLRDACSRLSHFDQHFSLSREGFDLRSLRLTGWSRLDRAPYRRNVDGAAREKVLARWAEKAPDQEVYMKGRKRLDALYFRTAWKRARCVESGEMLRWMRGERWGGLLARAARLGDEFALAGHVRDWRHAALLDEETAKAAERADRRHAARLMELNPPQGLLQLASLDIQDVRGAWGEEESASGRRLLEENLDDHIRLLELAGIECGDPCTPDAVDSLAHRLRSRLVKCGPKSCANYAEMWKLHTDLQRPYTERGVSRPARSLPHRKRVEAVALKHVLAVESLAEATGVEVDKELLRRMADPDDPELLTADEVEQARFEAAQLVAQLL